MAEHCIYLRGFHFPPTLPNKRANFRFVIDVRYRNDKGTLATENVVMPGLDTYWECDTGKSGDPNYVRAKTAPEFDMNKVDDWDELVLRLKADDLYMMRVKVFDVDRQDFWDRFLDAVSKLVGVLIGKAKDTIIGVPTIGGTLGSVVDEISSSIAKKLAGGDKVLFKGSQALAPGPVRIDGKGSTDGDAAGDYAILFEVVPV